jgi:Protein of unknown function (DUF3592)
MSIEVVSLGLLALAAYTARLAWFAWNSRKWPTVPGRMLYSAIYPGKGDIPTGTHVHYSYVVDGVAYESKRLRFGLFPPGQYPMALAELTNLQRTGQLRVFYDPRKPSRACLLTGMNELTFAVPFLLLIVSMVFMAADYMVSISS